MRKQSKERSDLKGNLSLIMRLISSMFVSIKRILSFLSKHSNILVALATFTLAGLTLSHIAVTRNMAVETKRLADISVEQFKIKSYPALVVYTPEINITSDSLIQTYIISNKGDITAHNVTFLPVLVCDKSGILNFKTLHGTYYEDIPTNDASKHEIKIFKEASRRVIHKTSYQKGLNISELKYSLFFIKYKVPYDTKYRYESVGTS